MYRKKKKKMKKPISFHKCENVDSKLVNIGIRVCGFNELLIVVFEITKNQSCLINVNHIL